MKNKTAELKLKISGAITLNRWLTQLPLEGQRSRQRTQFCNLLVAATNQMEETRLEMLKNYAEKNEDGSPKIYVDENNTENFDLTDENRAKFNKELQAFLEKDYPVMFDEEKMPLFTTIKNLLDTTDYKFSGAIALEYDNWCISFAQAN